MSEQGPQELQQQLAQQQHVINELCYVLRWANEYLAAMPEADKPYAMEHGVANCIRTVQQRLGNTVARYWPDAGLQRDEPLGPQQFDADGTGPAG